MLRRPFTIFSAASLLVCALALGLTFFRGEWSFEWNGISSYIYLDHGVIGVVRGSDWPYGILPAERWIRKARDEVALSISLIFAAIVAALPPAFWGIAYLSDRMERGWATQMDAERKPCPTCGYDLRATPDRCPECGVVASTPTAPTTPSLHR